MNYTVEISNDNLISLPDDLCAELSFEVGDILICVMDKERSKISMIKHIDQTLSDEQILAAGNLTRVISLTTADS
jgi:hypothetical protein